jgi:hypothetical protein
MQILEQATNFNKQAIKKQDETFNPQHFLARAINSI